MWGAASCPSFGNISISYFGQQDEPDEEEPPAPVALKEDKAVEPTDPPRPPLSPQTPLQQTMRSQTSPPQPPNYNATAIFTSARCRRVHTTHHTPQICPPVHPTTSGFTATPGPSPTHAEPLTTNAYVCTAMNTPWEVILKRNTFQPPAPCPHSPPPPPCSTSTSSLHAACQHGARLAPTAPSSSQASLEEDTLSAHSCGTWCPYCSTL